MLKRKALEEFTAWRGEHGNRALLVTGARQVGKTYLVKEFLHVEYENVIEFDLVEQSDVRAAFDAARNVEELFMVISAFAGQRLVPGKTVIFIDEVQRCKEAVTAIKYLVQQEGYDYVLSGSLLGVELRGVRSLPVGFVRIVDMYPLDFEEFCWAMGISEESISLVKDCIRERKEIPPAYMDVFDRTFRDFMLVGGMPEAVALFNETKDYAAVGRLQHDLIESCRKDINRYNEGSDRIKTEECFDSIPEQLAHSDKKFMFARVDGGKGRNSAAKYRNNLLWIENAGYGNMCRLVTDVHRPLDSSTERNQFKAYLSDTGLLMEMYGRGAKESLYEGDRYFNEGAIAENVFAECLVKSGIRPRYHRKSNGPNKMELDFVIELGRELTVIEIKSGKDRSAPSIEKVPRVFAVDRRMVMGNSNIYVTDDGIEHYPLFASAFITSMERSWDAPRF